jgi:hypothetical protein
MALYQTVDIEQIVTNTSPPIESRWVAVHNPVYLEYQRKDFEFDDVALQGGTHLRLDFASSTSTVQGDRLFVSCEVYEGLATVTSVSGNNLITDVALGFAPGTYPGFMNNLTQRPNYFIEIQITNFGGNEVLASLQASPDTTGKIGVDISGALQSFTSNLDGLPIQDNPDTQTIDENATIQFKYKARELWRPPNGLVTQAFGSPSANCYGINGSFPIGHLFNGNYAEYYPNTDSPKKFITDFLRPKYFEGWPFDIAFIFPQDFFSTDINLITSGYDVNGVQQSGSAVGINETALQNYFVRAVPDLDFSSATNPVVELLIQMQVDAGNIPILNNLFIDVVPAAQCCDGVFLKWLGEKGNRSYYFFNLRYSESMQVDGGDTYQTAFDGISDLRERANWYNKKAYKKLTVGANGISRNDAEGLKTLLKSTKVDYYDKNTGLTTGVLVEPGTFSIGRGDDTLFNVELSIVFPEQFNQTA